MLLLRLLLRLRPVLLLLMLGPPLCDLLHGLLVRSLFLRGVFVRDIPRLTCSSMRCFNRLYRVIILHTYRLDVRIRVIMLPLWQVFWQPGWWLLFYIRYIFGFHVLRLFGISCTRLRLRPLLLVVLRGLLRSLMPGKLHLNAFLRLNRAIEAWVSIPSLACQEWRVRGVLPP